MTALIIVGLLVLTALTLVIGIALYAFFVTFIRLLDIIMTEDPELLAAFRADANSRDFGNRIERLTANSD